MQRDEWSQSKLAQVADKKIVYGIVQAGAQDDEGIPYIKSSDVGQSIQSLGLSKTALAIHQKYHRSTVHPGDIVFSLRGNTGATSIVPTDLPEANLTQGTARIAVSAEFDNRFVRYVLASDIAMRQVLAVAKGSTFTEVSLDALRKITIPHPPLPEQRKIADILSTWDQAIEKTEALLSNARTQKRALMQQLLTGKRRFPAFEGQPWKEVRLGDLTDLITKGTTPTSVGFEFTDSGVNFIKAENVSDSGHILPTKTFISDECNEALKRSQFHAGDLLVTIAGAIGRIGIVHEENLPANTNQAVAIVRVPGSCMMKRRMLFYWLQGDHVQSIFRSSVTTGAQPNINLKQIGNLPIQVPSFAEQDMIVAALDAAAKEVDALADSITKLRTEKKALMQQLLTGKRRVVV